MGLRLLLIAACMASLIGDTFGKCASARFGDPGTRHPVPAIPVTVDLSKETDITVKINNIMPGCEAVATDVSMCGLDTITLTDPLTAVIHVSENSSQSEGVLYSSVYCDPFVESTIKPTESTKSPQTNCSIELLGQNGMI